LEEDPLPEDSGQFDLGGNSQKGRTARAGKTRSARGTKSKNTPGVNVFCNG
jgi:hypothetical protein